MQTKNSRDDYARIRMMLRDRIKQAGQGNESSLLYSALALVTLARITSAKGRPE